MRLPKITVNICVISKGSTEIVLQSLKKIRYPKHLYEILIIEGSHLTRQRNVGLRHSSGTIVYLLDNDSQVHPEAFHILASEFTNPKIAAVGGPSLNPKRGDTYLSK